MGGGGALVPLMEGHLQNGGITITGGASPIRSKTLTVLIKATGGAGVTGWEAGLHPGRVTGPSEDTHCSYTHLEEV